MSEYERVIKVFPPLLLCYRPTVLPIMTLIFVAGPDCTLVLTVLLIAKLGPSIECLLSHHNWIKWDRQTPPHGLTER